MQSKLTAEFIVHAAKHQTQVQNVYNHVGCVIFIFAGKLTMYTIHARHPCTTFAVIGAFDMYLNLLQFMESEDGKMFGGDKARATAMLYPLPGELDAGIPDGICHDPAWCR